MSKKIIAITTLTGFVAVCSGITWFTGNAINSEKIDSELTKLSSSLNEKYPNLNIKLVCTDYQKNIFSTKAKCSANRNDDSVWNDYVQIFHGPFPLNQLKKGHIKPLMFSFEKNTLSKENQEKLNIQLNASYTQNLTLHLDSKSYSFIYDDEKIQISPLNFYANMKNDKNKKSYLDSMHLKSDKIEYTNLLSSAKWQINQVNFDTKLNGSLHSENPNLSPRKINVSIGRFEQKLPMSLPILALDKIQFQSDVHANKSGIQSDLKTNIAQVQLGKNQLGNLNLNFQLQNFPEKITKTYSDFKNKNWKSFGDLSLNQIENMDFPTILTKMLAKNKTKIMLSELTWNGKTHSSLLNFELLFGENKNNPTQFIENALLNLNLSLEQIAEIILAGTNNGKEDPNSLQNAIKALIVQQATNFIKKQAGNYQIAGISLFLVNNDTIITQLKFDPAQNSVKINENIYSVEQVQSALKALFY